MRHLQEDFRVSYIFPPQKQRNAFYSGKSRVHRIAAKCELTGGSIVNIVQYCSLMAMKRGNNIIVYNDLMEGVKKEFQKAGITIS